MGGDCAGPAQLLNIHVAANKILTTIPNALITRFNIPTSSHLASLFTPKYTVPVKKVPHASSSFDDCHFNDVAMRTASFKDRSVSRRYVMSPWVQTRVWPSTRRRAS